MKTQTISASSKNSRTNIVLDDELIAKAMVRARVTTKKAAVEAALRAFVRAPDYSGLLALRGTGVIADDYDPKGLFMGSGMGLSHMVAEPAAPCALPETQRAKAIQVRAPRKAARAAKL